MFRLLELCAGYGSQALALKNLGLDVYSEIAEFDKYGNPLISNHKKVTE